MNSKLTLTNTNRTIKMLNRSSKDKVFIESKNKVIMCNNKEFKHTKNCQEEIGIAPQSRLNMRIIKSSASLRTTVEIGNKQK